MSHAMPRLSVFSRLLLCQRVAAGRPVAHVAAEMGVSRATAHKWLRRFREQGPAGLQDRSSRPHRCPHRLDARLERRILAARSTRRVGALIHIDVKKLGRIPDGGGWRVHGRGGLKKARLGYDYVHSAVDDHSRLAYSEILDDERGASCAAFLDRALAFFAAHARPVERIMTDNALAYRHSHDWRAVVDHWGVRQIFIKPHCPWTNGEVERYNRTLQTEWAYRQPWTSNQQRRRALTRWLRHYNHRRPHTALGGLPPISRLSTT